MIVIAQQMAALSALVRPECGHRDQPSPPARQLGERQDVSDGVAGHDCGTIPEVDSFGYGGPELNRPPAEPFSLLRSWIEHAVAAGATDPGTAVLATVRENGRPSTRAIEIKTSDTRGLVFFANLNSRKGRDLRANPAAAATLYWPEIMRQVNVTGDVQFTDDDESDLLWAVHSLPGRAVASLSEQGAPLLDENLLRDRATALAASGQELARPAGHAGFILVPATVEFWRGSSDRIHHRLHYGRDSSGWSHWLLQP